MGERMGRPTAVIELSGEERETLERWARRPKSAQALAMRCRIVLAAAEGRYNRDIAVELGCHPATVGKWRGRFALGRLDGLADDPRPGPPRKITEGGARNYKPQVHRLAPGWPQTLSNPNPDPIVAVVLRSARRGFVFPEVRGVFG